MKSFPKNKLVWLTIISLVLLTVAAGIFLLPEESDFLTMILVVSTIYLAYIIFSMYESFRADDSLLAESGKTALAILISATIAGLVLRALIGLAIPGYPADMSCWTAWSQAAAGSNFFSAYQNTSFLDYPPGYLYILHILGSLGNLLGIECLTPAYNLLLKMPAIIADIAMGWIIFSISKKENILRIGTVMAVVYIINPLTILNSAAWGQIDSILTLAVAGYIILLYRNRIFAATLVFSAGLLLKPQMLFFGPVLALVFIKYIISNGWFKGLKTFILSLLGGAGLFVAIVLPFAIGKEWTWIFSKYMGTINSYPYATLNAANTFGLLKLNWKPLETVFMGRPLSSWGMLGMIFSVLIYFIISFLDKDENDIFLLSSMLMTGLYTFGHKMHERYLFPIMAVLLVGFMYNRRGTEITAYALVTTALFINVAQVLMVTHIPPDDILYRLSSLAVILSFLLMTAACIVYAVKSRKKVIETEPGQDSLSE